MGGGYDVKSRSTLVKALTKVNNSVACKLDRWSLYIRTDGSVPKHQVMSNYFSIGVDAELALQFHTERENHPEKFSSRFQNKTQYFRIGMKNIFGKTLRHLERSLEVTYKKDGIEKQLEIPSGTIALIALNIPSIYGGQTLLKTKDVKMGSGTFMLVSVSMTNFAGVMTGVGLGQKLLETDNLKIKYHCDFSVQNDGEPWKVKSPGVIELEKHEQGQQTVLQYCK